MAPPRPLVESSNSPTRRSSIVFSLRPRAFETIHRIVKDLFCDGLFALPHQAVDKLRNGDAVIDRIGKNFAFCGNSTSWHNYFLGAAPFGLFAPYLERAWLRFATPEASSVPRIT